MKKVLIAVLAVIGLFSILAVGFVAVVALLAASGKERVPGSLVLEVNFETAIVESVPDDPLAQIMMEDTLQLRDVVEAIDRAAEDRRVKGMIARVGAGRMGLAHLQEIRDAIGRFRASGKPAYAFAETFGEFGPGNGGYYLATAFDRVYLQPSGDVGMTGLMYESPFIRGLLEKLGVTAQMGQRREFKNLMNFYTDRAYNEPYRLAMQELMDSQFDQIVRGIAEARGMTPEHVAGLFDQGPFYGAEALEAELVDALAYGDEVYQAISEETDEDTLVSLSGYLAGAGRPHRRGETIALIQGYGSVVRGSSSFSPLDGSVNMGSDSIAAAFQAAIDDRRVKAIVFRVDSPGGSYVASDTIWRETIRAKEADKPVIVSMGNLAASGGYFVAMNADKIVAQPGTITASIGVAGGKFLTRGFWDKLGVTWDDVHTSEHSRMWTGTYEYGPSEERFEFGLDRIYEDFTTRVAEGRGLSTEHVEQVARGRIWTGEDALELGLVDELGGLDVALRLAREAAGIDADASVRLKRFPRRRTPFELLFQRDRVALQAMARALVEVQPKVRMLKRLGLFGDSGVLSIPEPTY